MLNLPGTEGYKPSLAWITKRRANGSLASDLVTFVDNQRVTAPDEERMEKAGHTVSTRESYLGLQDALRKIRAPKGLRQPGAWAGANLCIGEKGEVMVLTSQDKWDRMKTICRHWLEKLNEGTVELDFKRLRSDQGFLVYVTQAYPAMKPYLNGFHLLLESWRQGRDNDGWKIPKPKKTMMEAEAEERSVGGEFSHDGPGGMEEIKMDLLTQTTTREDDRGAGPPSGITRAVPRFKEDLESILELASGDKPVMRCVHSRRMLTAFYGFGDASSAGFGSTMMRPRGIHGRFGLWSKDKEDKSSNYRELRNLVETVKEEAREGYL
jgi:hypothetical protein